MESQRATEYPIVSRLAAILIRVIVATCRVTRLEPATPAPTPAIYVFWHRHIFMMIPHFRNRNAHPLISQSRDGSLVAAVAERFGMDPIRGSSSAGGARAFLELAACLKSRREDVLITADGPKGPARIVKEGVTRLAEKTGFPVIPISWQGSRMMTFRKSWDRFIVPLPFSRIIISAGSPVAISELQEPEKRLGEILDELERTTAEQTHFYNQKELQ